MNLFKQIFSSWRSIVSVVLAYAAMVALFFYKPDLLNDLFAIASQSQDTIRTAASDVSERAAFLFGFAISPAAIFVTMMILFMRVVVLSVFLWLASLIVNGLFGQKGTH